MVRLRRLHADFHALQMLVAESPIIDIVQFSGDPAELYLLRFRCKGLVRPDKTLPPSISSVHEVEIYLHRNYPRQQPRLTWLTAIFHPNILSGDRNGGVCLGGWSPAETLADLCVRLAEMIQYQNFNTHDPLDVEAATWAAQHRAYFPIDRRPIINRTLL